MEVDMANVQLIVGRYSGPVSISATFRLTELRRAGRAGITFFSFELLRYHVVHLDTVCSQVPVSCGTIPDVVPDCWHLSTTRRVWYVFSFSQNIWSQF